MTKDRPLYAEIAVPLPMNRIFHYAVPEVWKGSAAVGKRVVVEFRNKEEIGYIVGFSDKAEVPSVKDIKSVIDDVPIVFPEMMELCRWISDSYLCSWGEAIHAAVPAALKKGKVSVKPRKTMECGADFHADTSHFVLTGEQDSALSRIKKNLDEKKHEVFLLHGVTGSGKTEIYLRVIQHALGQGKTSIILVPEISLTPQTVGTFSSRFGDTVAVIHSGLTGAMKFSEWDRIKKGSARIIVGARSAVFSPLKDLGAVIIDEEHETSYKQEDVPRYHARDVAIKRAEMSGAVVVLGSATPSCESYYRADKGDYTLLKLTHRIDNRPMPPVKLVDMRQELAARKRLVMFSNVLITELEKTVNAGKQALVFLNRRGFSTYISCKACGYVVKCRKCDAIMVYHFDKKSMVCHYCDARSAPPEICPKCRSSYVKYMGVGTEKVESELAHFLPKARIARMDADATSAKGSHDRILGDFKKRKIDILVGTQMIAKGFDFPEVTLVGVVNADVTLNIPDFRSAERTFGLITQVAGRSGRGDDCGLVIVQTYAPENYAMVNAAKHDFEHFYETETEIRRKFMFPPFSHIIKITVRARDEKKAIDEASALAAEIKGAGICAEVLGPAPAPVSRVRGYFRWNVLLKGADRSKMTSSLRTILENHKRPAGVLQAVDVDSISV